MENDLFKKVAVHKENPKWTDCLTRRDEMSKRDGDLRSDFTRDYQRILHNNAYGRLKHKTQVFFATQHDHICTRIEHVNHVASVSSTIAKYLGLNSELTGAIAIGHDLGHAPFGHEGERIIGTITRDKLDFNFWHEKNSLRFVDNVITLENARGKVKNLNLTYAVRDGIVSHCGEVDENALIPRQEKICLEDISKPNQYEPFTWEGCVVKVADKIAYLGRDIEDAVSLKFLTQKQEDDFKKMVRSEIGIEISSINNTSLIHHFVNDVCHNSSPETGIRFSNKYLKLINSVKEFNYRYIYNHKRLKVFHEYAELILMSLFRTLEGFYDEKLLVDEMEKSAVYYPELIKSFKKWLWKYSDINPRNDESRYENRVIYQTDSKSDYYQAIVDFLSGMTDHFAIKLFEELTSF